MMTMAILFSVTLYSRGDCLRHGLIRACFDIQASDDVEAAMQAKTQARQQWPDRDKASWFTDRVERKGKRA